MFVLNREKKAIELRSFGGFKFTVPSGVSWVWDKAGEHLVETYKVQMPVGAKIVAGGRSVDKYGFDNGHGVPPLVESTKEEWVKGGKKLCVVERYKINGKLVPRKALIARAQKSGIGQDRIMEYVSDTDLDARAIAEDINALPVPEEVSHPVELLNEETKEEVPQMA